MCRRQHFTFPRAQLDSSRPPLFTPPVNIPPETVVVPPAPIAVATTGTSSAGAGARSDGPRSRRSSSAAVADEPSVGELVALVDNTLAMYAEATAAATGSVSDDGLLWMPL
jgi:hypothetical protein